MASKVTLDHAQSIIDAARKKAEDEGLAMNIAVVDDGNNLVAFAHMDGAWLGSIDIALNKAHTARAFDMPTEDLVSMTQPGQPLYGLEVSTNGRVVIFPGGIPLKSGDTVIGAVGVSGGLVDQDQMVCEAGVAAFSA